MRVTSRDLNIKKHLIDGYVVSDNTPNIGYIQWADVNITYKGVTYTIQNGYTNYRYIYWDFSVSTTQLIVSDTFPTLTDDDILLFYNKNGIHLTVPTASVIEGGLIVPGSILAEGIAANTITSLQIAANAITTNELASNSVTADAVAANAIGAAAIAAGAIQTDHLSASAVTANKIVSGAVTTAKLAANAVTANTIATNAVTAGKIAANAVTANNIAANAVTAAKITAGTIATSHISTNGISASKIKGDTLTLGGASDVNGLLSIRDASNTEVVRGDRYGLKVDGGSYLITDKGMDMSLLQMPNMIPDHSFECLERGSLNSAYNSYEISGSCGFTHWVKTGSPKILSARQTGGEFIDALYDLQCAVVNSSNYLTTYWWRTRSTTYYVSGFVCRGYYRNPSYGTPRIRVECYNDSHSLLQSFQQDFTLTSTYDWKRVGFSFTVPSDTLTIEVRVTSTNSYWVYWDGIQLVEGDKPVKYEPESSLWPHFWPEFGGHPIHPILSQPDPPHWTLSFKNVSLKALSGGNLQVRNAADTAYTNIVALSFIETSSREYKEDIVLAADTALDTVINTPVYTYRFKEGKGDDKKRIGVIAEESPDIIRVDDTISLSNSVGLLWKAVQELNGKVDALTKADVSVKEERVKNN